MELSLEFFIGAFTVGLFFGGYWFWNKIKKIEDNFYRELTDYQNWCSEDLERTTVELRKHIDTTGAETKHSINDIYNELNDMRNNVQDRIRETEHSMEAEYNDLRSNIDDIRKEFDSRIVGESRNMQRMLNVKLNKSQSVSESV